MPDRERPIPQPDDSDIVMELRDNGEIVSVLQGPAWQTGSPPKTLADLWPTEAAAAVLAGARRSIRNRRLHTVNMTDSTGDAAWECLCIPRGPGRVLLVARDRSTSGERPSGGDRDKNVDHVTGLPGRDFIVAEIERVLDQQRLREGRSAVIAIHAGVRDCDSHNVMAGQEDELMAQIAGRLNDCLRNGNRESADDAVRDTTVARSGSNEFMILLASIASGDDAEAVAGRVIGALTEPVILGGQAIVAETCAGIALVPQDGTAAEQLLGNARVALDSARNGATGSYRFYSGTTQLPTLQRLDLETSLKAALISGDFGIQYLPAVEAASDDVHSIEALLRWPSAMLAARSIRRTIEMAERTGVIVSIGDWVLRQACEQLKRWHESGFPELKLAINLSGQELADETLADRVVAALEASDVAADRLEFEITERDVYRDANLGFANCRGLKETGVGLVVDDFGTGNCSLSTMAHCPVDQFKIDNTLVANLQSDERSRAACAAAIAMAHELGLKASAEGVETRAQADLLRTQGCDILQGFYFFEPASPDDVPGLLEAYASRRDERRRAS